MFVADSFQRRKGCGSARAPPHPVAPWQGMRCLNSAALTARREICRLSPDSLHTFRDFFLEELHRKLTADNVSRRPPASVDYCAVVTGRHHGRVYKQRTHAGFQRVVPVSHSIDDDVEISAVMHPIPIFEIFTRVVLCRVWGDRGRPRIANVQGATTWMDVRIGG